MRVPKNDMRRVVILFVAIVLMGVGCREGEKEIAPSPNPALQSGDRELRSGGQAPAPQDIQEGAQDAEMLRTDFAKFNSVFRFSVEIPSTWKVEYVPEIEAINVYDPAEDAQNVRAQSQFFIRYFEANRFLTLRTVDILEREEIEVDGHPAVRYEIEKKPGVGDFAHQPSWRNARHRLTDVRLTSNNPSLFYVFSYNPSLDTSTFDSFLRSVTFHNDAASFVSPLDRAGERITKKPFGLYVTPENSPIKPERFSGYHTAVDFEVLDKELRTEIEIKAFCGGDIREKRIAAGYGGVVVQECLIGDEPVTVVYGHLRVDPSPPLSPTGGGIDIEAGRKGVGDYLSPGDVVGALGAGGTAETDGERKHLHFGIHQGARVDIRGYVPREQDLDQWIDPWQYISRTVSTYQ